MAYHWAMAHWLKTTAPAEFLTVKEATIAKQMTAVS